MANFFYTHGFFSLARHLSSGCKDCSPEANSFSHFSQLCTVFQLYNSFSFTATAETPVNWLRLSSLNFAIDFLLVPRQLAIINSWWWLAISSTNAIEHCEWAALMVQNRCLKLLFICLVEGKWESKLFTFSERGAHSLGQNGREHH